MAATGFSWLAYAETTTATSDGSEKANVQPSTAILSNDHGISLMKEASTEQTSASSSSSSSSKNPDEVVSGNIVDIASSGADCSSSPLISRDLRATIELKRQKALALKRKREESEVSASRGIYVYLSLALFNAFRSCMCGCFGGFSSSSMSVTP